MTQDMKKVTILHKISQLIVPLKRTMSPLEADSHSAPGRHFFNRSLLLLLMLTLGVTGVNAQLPTLTTDTDNNNTIDESEKHYYLIQGAQVPTFYCIPASNGTNVNTTNVPSENMLWYFLDAGTDDNNIQYYYIIHKSGKYLYKKNDNDGGIQLTTTAGTTDVYKFRIEEVEATDYYFIRVKGSSKYVNKKSGNVATNPLKNSDASDNNSQWQFIAKEDLSWEFPFTFSTNETKAYYKINHKADASFYISLNGTSVCTSNATDDDNMVWYFEQVPTEKGSNNYITYCYIVNAVTGKYMHFDGTVQDNSQDDVCSVQTKTSENEERCQFIVVRAAKTGGKENKEVIECYAIIPRLLKDKIWNNHCIGKKDNNVGTGVYTATDRNNNTAHWIFESTTFDGVWADPEITCDLDGHITITNGEEAAGAVFYYTIDGSTVPTTENTQYDAINKPTVNAGITTIKVRSIGGTRQPSNVITKTIVYYPTITFTEDSYTYTGSAQNPVSSVDYVDANNSANNIHFEATTHYTVSYKKGDDVVSECKNADAYTVVINDVEGDDYIVCGTKLFTINQKSVTITADDATKTYNGTALTKNTFTTSALEAGDTHEFAVTMTEGSTITNVGSQSNVIATVDGIAVTTGTATSVGNYLVTTADGTLTINPKAVTITANDASKTYNSTALTEAGFTASALEEGDTHTFTVVMTEGSTITNVGTQPNVIATVDGVEVTTGTATAVGNYSVTTANGTLTINAKAVTITASNAEKEYDGTPLTSDGFTATDLEAGDTHTFTVVMTEGSTITNVGTQPNVIATVDGTAVTTGEATAIGNYLVTTANGTLTINKKTLTITADSDTKVYDGTALTKDSYTSEGLMTGDNIESVSITGSQTNVGTSYNVPSEAVVKKGDAVVTDSYAINYVNGTLTITPAAVTVTAVAESKTYGEADPDLTANVEGMVNDESSALITYSLSRAEGEDVGEYTITPTGDAEQGNYSISYTTGMLTIGPKELGITWTHTDDLVYNGSAQKPTATATGLVGSDVIGVTVKVTGGGTNAGSYTATASELTGEKAGNYKLPETAQTTYKIAPASLVAVTFSPTELVYNGAEQMVSIASVTAGVGGTLDVPDTDYIISSGSLSGTNAGSYPVTVLSNSTNYTGSVNASFTIEAKAIGDNTNLASDFSVEIGTGNALILKDGETPLTAGTDYTIGDPQPSTSGRYSTRTITGTGNYNFSAVIRNAIVNFTTDDSESEWTATFVAENASGSSPDATQGHALPDGVTAYIITSIEGDNANSEPMNYIPEGVPVVLVSDKASSGFVVENANPTEEQKITDSQKTANMLKEVTETTTGYVTDPESPYYQTVHFDVAKIYLLYKNEFVLNKEGYLAKGNVYMNKPAAAPARLKISKGDNTGIENIEYTIESQSDAWYTLDGRRLSSKPTKKGLYLQGGKKIVVK